MVDNQFKTTEADGPIIVVRFDSWLFSNQKQPIGSLFEELPEEIGALMENGVIRKAA